MKQLDRLLFEQGGECFFCRKSLPKSEASVEHLLAVANGGSNHEDNCVACCKSLNALLASKGLKQKIQIILNQRGAIKCPAEMGQNHDSVELSSPAPLKVSKSKQPAATLPPPKVAMPIATLAAVKLPKPSSSAAVALPVSVHGTVGNLVQCPTCKTSVSAAVGQVDYKCHKCGCAFRY